MSAIWQNGSTSQINPQANSLKRNEYFIIDLSFDLRFEIFHLIK